jgi:serine/threonine protein kinase
MLICQNVRTGAGCGAHYPSGTAVCRDPACAQSLRYALELRDPNQIVGNYRIIRLIDHGSFGAVYEAQHTATLLTVALKETFSQLHSAAFQAELATLQGMRHPHLPRYDEAFERDGHGYLVMEFVPGQSLAQVLARQAGPVAEGQLLGYALQLCDVVNYLHGASPPLLHRDIKPANVRITPEGLIKLVDFGLAKQGGQQTRATVSGFGTPAYAPLEQYSGGTSIQSDIYSLGATLYHLATNTEPPSAIERFSAPADPLIAPGQLNPTLAPHVAAALLKALALPQHERHASMDAFKLALLGLAPAGPAPYLAAQPPTPAVAATVALHQPQWIWQQWPVVFADSFKDNRNNWSVGPITHKHMGGQRLLGMGRFSIEGVSSDNAVTVSIPGRLQPRDRGHDCLISVEGQTMAGPALPDYGIIFCAQATPPASAINTYYCFQINDAQTFAVWLWNSAWTYLINTTHSSLIRPGERNKIAVRISRRQLIFFINDQYVTDIEATEIPGGSAGVLMELKKAGDAGTVNFYNFEVRAA